MKDGKMGNTWPVLIKSILHIFREKSYSKLLSYPLASDGGRGVVPTKLFKLTHNSWNT